MTHSRLRYVALASGVVIAAAVILVVALSSTVGTSSRRVDRLASRPPNAVRAKQVRERNEAAYDDGYETCLAAGLATLARRLDVTNPTARTVAEAYAQGFDPAYRPGPFQGCFDALRGA